MLSQLPMRGWEEEGRERESRDGSNLGAAEGVCKAEEKARKGVQRSLYSRPLPYGQEKANEGCFLFGSMNKCVVCTMYT